MAITKKDELLKARVKNLIKQFEDKPEKEIIYIISAICKISHRTASEHFHAFRAQQNLNEIRFKEKCLHDWSTPAATPGGLMRECRLCGITEEVKIT